MPSDAGVRVAAQEGMSAARAQGLVTLIESHNHRSASETGFPVESTANDLENAPGVALSAENEPNAEAPARAPSEGAEAPGERAPGLVTRLFRKLARPARPG